MRINRIWNEKINEEEFFWERLKVFLKAFRLSRSLRVRLKCYSAPTSIFYDNCLIEKRYMYCIRMFTHALMGKQYWKVNVNFQLVFHSWDEIEIYFFSLASFLSVLYFLLFSLALFIFTSTPPLSLRNFPRLCIDE